MPAYPLLLVMNETAIPENRADRFDLITGNHLNMNEAGLQSEI